jgi:hypothetical protein
MRECQDFVNLYHSSLCSYIVMKSKPSKYKLADLIENLRICEQILSKNLRMVDGFLLKILIRIYACNHGILKIRL